VTRKPRPTLRLIKPPIPDPTLTPFRSGLGVLWRGETFAGNVATSLSSFWSPSSPLRMQWWVLYVVIWADGTRERSTEDYPPAWCAVNEMKQGYLEWSSGEPARDGVYRFEWLTSAEAESGWISLGVTLDDF